MRGCDEQWNFGGRKSICFIPIFKYRYIFNTDSQLFRNCIPTEGCSPLYGSVVPSNAFSLRSTLHFNEVLFHLSPPTQEFCEVADLSTQSRNSGGPERRNVCSVPQASAWQSRTQVQVFGLQVQCSFLAPELLLSKHDLKGKTDFEIVQSKLQCSDTMLKF